MACYIEMNSIVADTVEKLLYVNGSQPGGYKKDILIQNISHLESEILMCSICENILFNARISTDLDAVGCEDCFKSANIDCKPFNKGMNIIFGLNCRCPLYDRGCSYTSVIRNISNHLKNDCRFFQIKCQNGCGKVFMKSQISKHKKSCTLRKINCRYCGESCVFANINQHNKSECLEYPINCYLGCEEIFLRKTLKIHLNTCEYAVIECSYSKYGCLVTCKRKDMASHMTVACQTHLDLAVNKLSSDLEEAKITIEELKQKVDDFESNQDSNSNTNVECWDDDNQDSNSNTNVECWDDDNQDSNSNTNVDNWDDGWD